MKNNTLYCDYLFNFCRKTTNFNKIMCKIRKIKKERGNLNVKRSSKRK